VDTKPRMPWVFLGGYLPFFVGLAAGFVGAFEFSGARDQPFMDPIVSLSAIGLGIAMSASGSLAMARSERIRGCHMSGLIVCLVMTPIPALMGLGINYLGAQPRKTPAAGLQKGASQDWRFSSRPVR